MQSRRLVWLVYVVSATMAGIAGLPSIPGCAAQVTLQMEMPGFETFLEGRTEYEADGFTPAGLEIINATLTAYALAYLRFPFKN